MYGGQANVDASNTGPAMPESLAAGQQYKAMHAGQYGGNHPLNTSGSFDEKGFPSTLGPQGQQMPVQMGGVAPVTAGDQQTLASSAPELVGASRTLPLNESMAAIQGMSDQAGGRRRRKSTCGGSRKGRKKTMMGGARKKRNNTMGGSRKGRKNMTMGGSRKKRNNTMGGSRKGRKNMTMGGSRKGRKNMTMGGSRKKRNNTMGGARKGRKNMTGGSANVDWSSSLINDAKLDAIAVSGQNPETVLLRDPTALAPDGHQTS